MEKRKGKPLNPAIITRVAQKKSPPIATEQEQVFTPQAIYCDTNVLRSARWPKGNAQLEQIIQYSDWLNVRLCLPEVVRRELEGNWVRSVQNQWQNTNSQIATLSGLIKPLRELTGLPTPPSKQELKEKFQKESQVLTERLALVPLTTRQLSDFVDMAIFREAAFDDSGKGFRDSVILCSIIEHMVANRCSNGVLVSEDRDFRQDAVARLAGNGLELKLLRNFDELAGLLEQTKNKAIQKYVQQEQKELEAALHQQLPVLDRYIVENFAIAPEDLRVDGALKKIESIQVLGIKNAHEGFFLSLEGLPEPNRVRVSVDVEVRLKLDIEPYPVITAPPMPPQTRLKAGGVVVEVPPSPRNVLIPTFFRPLPSDVQNVVVVVEAEATKTEKGYSDFRFTGVYLKRGDWTLNRLLS